MLPEHMRQYDAGWTVLRQRRGHSALFKGDYKIVVDRGPVGDGQ